MSIKSVKYLFKCVSKFHDCVNIEVKELSLHDEIKTFTDSRYVSAPEAMYSDYLVSICMKKVTTLCVYLSAWKIYKRSNLSRTKNQFCKQKEKHLLPGSHAETES